VLAVSFLYVHSKSLVSHYVLTVWNVHVSTVTEVPCILCCLLHCRQSRFTARVLNKTAMARSTEPCARYKAQTGTLTHETISYFYLPFPAFFFLCFCTILLIFHLFYLSSPLIHPPTQVKCTPNFLRRKLHFARTCLHRETNMKLSTYVRSLFNDAF
jgi:hypothetical protein